MTQISSETVKDWHVFFIAKIIILAFSIIFGYAVVNEIGDETLKTIWGVWIGAVIGYFFGSRPVAQLSKRTEDLLGMVKVKEEDLERKRNRLRDKQVKMESAKADAVKTFMRYE